MLVHCRGEGNTGKQGREMRAVEARQYSTVICHCQYACNEHAEQQSSLEPAFASPPHVQE
eukprot:SAG22_NODE_1008_length_6054_cov_11.023678_6_plen_60_part_00